jgi:hypothetical protein
MKKMLGLFINVFCLLQEENTSSEELLAVENARKTSRTYAYTEFLYKRGERCQLEAEFQRG